jgi:hypothetical protein
MRDKASTGATDPRKDHHMIDGRLVPVVEPAANRSQKARSAKRQKAATGTADARPAAKAHT